MEYSPQNRQKLVKNEQKWLKILHTVLLDPLNSPGSLSHTGCIYSALYSSFSEQRRTNLKRAKIVSTSQQTKVLLTGQRWDYPWHWNKIHSAIYRVEQGTSDEYLFKYSATDTCPRQSETETLQLYNPAWIGTHCLNATFSMLMPHLTLRK